MENELKKWIDEKRLIKYQDRLLRHQLVAISVVGLVLMGLWTFVN